VNGTDGYNLIIQYFGLLCKLSIAVVYKFVNPL